MIKLPRQLQYGGRVVEFLARDDLALCLKQAKRWMMASTLALAYLHFFV